MKQDRLEDEDANDRRDEDDMRNSEGFDDVRMAIVVMLMRMLVMLMKMLVMLMRILVMLMIDFQVPHHPLPFPTSGLWFHPLSYDSKVNTFLFKPNEIKII